MAITRAALARPWWMLPPGRIRPFWWVAIGAVLISVDYLAGPAAQFPSVNVLPVIVAAWYSGRRTALAIAAAVPLAHVMFLVAVWTPGALAIAIAATAFRAAVIILIGLWFARLSDHERDIHRYVRRLEGLLAICSFCKSIRNTSGEWEPLETFISSRSDAQFSHGLCARCGKVHYPDIDLEDSVEDAPIGR
jgi:hypothetical protein